MAQHETHLNMSIAHYRPEEVASFQRLLAAFTAMATAPDIQLTNFPRFVRTQDLTRFLVYAEVFKLVLPIHGIIAEVGVLEGFSLFSFAQLSEIFEPRNYTRQVYGFDTFRGFASIAEQDRLPAMLNLNGTSSLERLQESVEVFNASVLMKQFPKVHLIPGDAVETVPRFVEQHPGLVPALLSLQVDIYRPTLAALQSWYPRMPKGGVVLLVSTNCEATQGETMALQDAVGVGTISLRRFPFATKYAYFVKE